LRSGCLGLEVLDLARRPYDLDSARLRRLRHLTYQLDFQQAVFERGTADLHVVGKRELPLEGTRRDAAVQIVPPGSCEFKGRARYWSIAVGTRRSYKAAWSYDSPTAGFEAISGYLAFYASRIDECWVGDELVQAQEGDFYGGWITLKIVGPFKGGPGTVGW
jgi:hypothetical protein